MKKLMISLLTFLTLLSGAITFVNADTTTSTPIQQSGAMLQSNDNENSQDINQYNQDVSNTIPITARTFDYFVKTGHTAIVYIGSPECPHCQKFVPTLHNFINDTGTPVFYLDMSNPGAISQNFLNDMQRFQIDSAPTVLLLHRGRIIKKYVGDTITECQLMSLAWLQWHCW